MVTKQATEQWKTIKFPKDICNKGTTEVSNLGRLRTFNALSSGNILKGSMINGYRIIRLKLYTYRAALTQQKLDVQQLRVDKLARKLRRLKEKKYPASEVKPIEQKFKSLKLALSRAFATDLKERTIHYHSLVHRLVATYFLKMPLKGHTIVGHLNYNKLDNTAANLQWMTPDENYQHQQGSPYVIKEKRERNGLQHREKSRASKLSIVQVKQLKMLLNKGVEIKILVKKFKITDTQIYRIKRGENWADVKAATA